MSVNRHSNLDISPASQTAGGTIGVALDVTNTGTRAGDEIVQLTIADAPARNVRDHGDRRGPMMILREVCVMTPSRLGPAGARSGRPSWCYSTHWAKDAAQRLRGR